MGLIKEAPPSERAEYFYNELEQFLASQDGVDRLALIALGAGTAAAELAHEVARGELGRKVVHLNEADVLKQGGMSETKALDQARASETYMLYCSALNDGKKALALAELTRDVALMVGRSL